MRRIITSLIIAATSLSASAILPSEVRWSNETQDTTKITDILIKAEKQAVSTPQEHVGFIARQFIGTPYAPHTLEGSPERLTVNLEQLDCTTFVETVLALAITAGEHRTSWRDFIHNLERIRYRNGELNGYSSRLHYISDWIVDNTHRGNFAEITNRMEQNSYQVKTLDFMSRNRDKYPALKDSTQWAKIRDVERGYMSHRFPYLKTRNITYKPNLNALKDGDAVAFTTKIPGLDVSHLGFIVIENGHPRLLHASQSAGKVIIDDLSLTEYLKRAKNITGIRIIRLK